MVSYNKTSNIKRWYYVHIAIVKLFSVWCFSNSTQQMWGLFQFSHKKIEFAPGGQFNTESIFRQILEQNHFLTKPWLKLKKRRARGSIMFKEQTKKSYAWLQAWDRVLSVPDTSVLKRWGLTEPHLVWAYHLVGPLSYTR